MGVGAFIARWGFWLLLIYGLAWGEVSRRALVAVGGAWVAGFFAQALLPINGDMLFTALVALLDVALVFIVFKGDVRL